jgi:ABC-type multidrug transport system fused ATPase/permease subunit
MALFCLRLRHVLIRRETQDEATSNVDVETDAKVQKTIQVEYHTLSGVLQY